MLMAFVLRSPNVGVPECVSTGDPVPGASAGSVLFNPSHRLMNSHLNRRHFIKTSAGLGAFAAAVVALPGLRAADLRGEPGTPATTPTSADRFRRVGGPKLRTSLNAFSFNDAILGSKKAPPSITLLELLDFCAQHNFDAIDPTGYYFPGYPKVPTDDYIATFKKRAFELGLGISGTGIRNNFASPDKAARAKDVQLAKDWIEVAAKLGAPVIRVFAGAEAEGADREEIYKWMAEDIRTLAEHGKKFGVIVGVQNHGDFLRTAAQTIKLVEMVNSEWVGVILDTGNYPGDPYAEIAAVLPYTVNFQIKESPYGKDSPVRLDLRRFVKIVRDAGYRGYLPIETLVVKDVPYDPFKLVPVFHAQVMAAFAEG
jgi:sugar phosphate isomerase/epimerase